MSLLGSPLLRCIERGTLRAELARRGDLRFHGFTGRQFSDVEKTAFGSLVRARVVIILAHQGRKHGAL
jgi:hypothetical protein